MHQFPIKRLKKKKLSFGFNFQFFEIVRNPLNRVLSPDKYILAAEKTHHVVHKQLNNNLKLADTNTYNYLYNRLLW